MSELSRASVKLLFTFAALMSVAIGVVFANDGEGSTLSDRDQQALLDNSAVDDALRTIEPTAQRLWPESYGGLWIDGAETANPIVNVAFTSGASEKLNAIALSLPREARTVLHAVTVSRSYASLEATQDDLIVDREEPKLALPGIEGGHYDINLAVPENRIEVYADRLDVAVAQAAATARYGEGVVVEQRPLPSPVSCTRADCRYSLRSGLDYRNTLGGYCSSGFTTVRPNGSRQTLSAGHCDGIDRIHGGETFGAVGDERAQGRVDAERIRIDDPFLGKPWIYKEDMNQSATVLSQGTYSGLMLGEQVCKAGARSGKTCGEVVSKKYAWDGVPLGRDFIAATTCVMPGDSGAGVYSLHKAEAIAAGGFELPCEDWNDKYLSVSGHLEFALQNLDLSLVTAN